MSWTVYCAAGAKGASKKNPILSRATQRAVPCTAGVNRNASAGISVPTRELSTIASENVIAKSTHCGTSPCGVKVSTLYRVRAVMLSPDNIEDTSNKDERHQPNHTDEKVLGKFSYHENAPFASNAINGPLLQGEILLRTHCCKDLTNIRHQKRKNKFNNFNSNSNFYANRVLFFLRSFKVGKPSPNGFANFASLRQR